MPCSTIALLLALLASFSTCAAAQELGSAIERSNILYQQVAQRNVEARRLKRAEEIATLLEKHSVRTLEELSTMGEEDVINTFKAHVHYTFNHGEREDSMGENVDPLIIDGLPVNKLDRMLMRLNPAPPVPVVQSKEERWAAAAEEAEEVLTLGRAERRRRRQARAEAQRLPRQRCEYIPRDHDLMVHSWKVPDAAHKLLRVARGIDLNGDDIQFGPTQMVFGTERDYHRGQRLRAKLWNQKDARMCCETCELISGCDGFVYDIAARNCYIKSNAVVQNSPPGALYAARAQNFVSGLLLDDLCVPEVQNLGCFAESWPMAGRRAAEVTVGWVMHSPMECACMCRLRYGSRWNGIVSLGTPPFGSCACSLPSDTTFLKYDARGELPERCCNTYDAGREVIVRGADGEAGKARKDWCNAQRKPHSEWSPKAQIYPEEKSMAWSTRFFHVKLCDKCDASRLGTCPRRYSNAPQTEWANFTSCKSRDHQQFCDVGAAPTAAAADNRQPRAVESSTSTLRIGSRIPGVGDVISERTVELAHNEKRMGCRPSMLLTHPIKRARRKARGREVFPESGLHYSTHYIDIPHSVAVTEVHRLTDASMTWMCNHASIMRLNRISCWTQLKPGDIVGAKDCVPSPTTVGALSASDACSRIEPRVEDSRDFIARVTKNMKVDIINNMRGVCPNIAALSMCLRPLLRERAFPWPANPTLAAKTEGAIAIIVPYRGRPSELRKWLWWMLPVLLRQGTKPFGIFVAELVAGPLWNKARLNNAAVKEVRKLHPAFDCFIFADVDLVLQADAADLLVKQLCKLECDALPIHFTTLLRGYEASYDVPMTEGVFCSAETRGEECVYPHYHGGQSSGGIVGLTATQFDKVDGWPNSVWGWGSEDGIFDGRIKKVYGQNRAPMELTAVPGNGKKCVFVHMTDDDSEIKGVMDIDRDEMVIERPGNGYANVDSLYTLIGVESAPYALYTKFVINLEGELAKASDFY